MAVEINGEGKAYPIPILTWHEIVNDEVGGVPVAVTFCPLCNTALVFKRDFEGQILDLGVSGNLRNSDLIMYDRQSETWWQQATGEGIVGEHAGKRLEFVPASMVAFQDFKDAFPDGSVRSRDSGFLRRYERVYGWNSYVQYDAKGARPFLFSGRSDERLECHGAGRDGADQ